MYAVNMYQQQPEMPAVTSSDWANDMSSFLTDLDSSEMCPEISPINMYNETGQFDNFFPEQVMGMNVHSVSPSCSQMSSDKSDSGIFSDDSVQECWAPPTNFANCIPPTEHFYPNFMSNAPIPMEPFQQCKSSSSIAPKKRRRRKQTVVQRGAANLRERKRMFYLNDAFDDLKKSLPKKDNKSRLSRIDTLKTAIDYIQSLSELLHVV